MENNEKNNNYLVPRKAAISTQGEFLDFVVYETESTDMPSFLRNKVSEGRGRRTQK